MSDVNKIEILISSSTTLKELKLKTFEDFNIPINEQHWYIENTLLDDEQCTIFQLCGPKTTYELNLRFNSRVKTDINKSFNSKCYPFASYSCINFTISIVNDAAIIAKDLLNEIFDSSFSSVPEICETNVQATIFETVQEINELFQYKKLLEIEESCGHVSNLEPIYCELCKMTCEIGEGCILRGCVHAFCKNCLRHQIEYSDNSEIFCPFNNGYKCENVLLQHEIRSLVGTEVFVQYLEKSFSKVYEQIKLEEDRRNQREEYNPELNYMDIMEVEDSSEHIPNSEPFNCPICLSDFQPNAGCILRDCLHMFCIDCLGQTIELCEDAEVVCPFANEDYTCSSVLQDREVRSLVSDIVYRKHLLKSLRFAEQRAKNPFHCKTLNCLGWCEVEDNVAEFLCPVCNEVNCLICNTIHAGLSCNEYKNQFRTNDEKSEGRLKEMVNTGEAMRCPTCGIHITKIEGCDGMTCSSCKTAICWATRGPRWGPRGKGDTSGGCRCNTGKKCSPMCNNCH